MKTKYNTPQFRSSQRNNSGLKPFIQAAIVALSLGSAALTQANPCSYGELFNFGSKNLGTINDIDHQPVAVGVTADTDSGMSTITSGAVGAWGSGTEFMTNPSLDASTTYGGGLFLYSATNGDTLDKTVTFTFSKSMRNLVLSFNNGTGISPDGVGKSRLFTFTDAAGNPVPIGIRSYRQLSTTGLTDQGVFEQVAANKLLAVGGSGAIEFLVPVTTLKMKVELPAGQGTGPGTQYAINFSQYCDEVGMLGNCMNPRSNEWAASLSLANGGSTKLNGRIVTEKGDVTSLNYTVSPPNLATNNNPVPIGTTRVATSSATQTMPYTWHVIEMVGYANPNATGTTQTFTFGKSVSMPSIIGRGGSQGTYTFFKADGVTPLPFIMRNPGDPELSRQIDSNVLYAPGSGEFNLQFTEATTAIVVKATDFGTGFASQMGVYTNCTGIATDSGSQAGKDSDGDGVPDMVDKCPNTPVGATVGEDGCPLPTDLSITKTASTNVIVKGQPFTYTITVTNTGAEANNVEASDIIPNGLNIVAGTPPAASNAGTVTTNGSTVTAKWAIVPAGETRTLTITVVKP